MTNRRFDKLFGAPPRRPEDRLTQRDMDLAASVQAVTEEVMLRLTRSIAAESGAENLCLAGGVALNCVANGKILRDCRFRRIWIQPAAGDAGGALGAALVAFHGFRDGPRTVVPSRDSMRGSYLGPAFEQADIERRLAAAGARLEVLGGAALLDACAGDLAAGKALGWVQGRMEFGPRALGGRSILGDPAPPPCRRPSTSRSSIASRSGPSPPRCCGSMLRTGSSWTGTAPTCCWWRTWRRSVAAR